MLWAADTPRYSTRISFSRIASAIMPIGVRENRHVAIMHNRSNTTAKAYPKKRPAPVMLCPISVGDIMLNPSVPPKETLLTSVPNRIIEKARLSMAKKMSR